MSRRRAKTKTPAPPRPSPERPPVATGGPGAQPPRGASRRKWALHAALAVLAPVAVLGLTELGLRAFGYGHPASLFVPRPDGGGFVTNPHFGSLFADPATAPRLLPAALPAAKEPDTRRIFILGEDAAQGAPDPASGFGRVLELLLRHRHPGVRFEVVNCAVPGTNSHAVLRVARECARYEPDVFVVYMGHNEALGPFGPAAVPGPAGLGRALIRAHLWARSLRVGQLANSIVRRTRPEAGPPTEERFAAARIPPGDPRRQAARDRFRANLADVIAAGREADARVVTCTVGSNLRDCPPFASLHRSDLTETDRTRWDEAFRAGVALEQSGRHAEAAEKYRAAERIADGHAELHFRLARCCLALQLSDEARRHFILARDTDALPLRADSDLNEAIRQLTGGREAEGVYLADAERELEQDPRSPHGLPGRELFWDHARLRFEGNYAVARSVLGPVEAALGLSGPPAPLPSAVWCAEQVPVTAFDRRRAAERVLRATARPPFTGQLDHTSRVEEQVRALAGLVVARPELARAGEQYAAAVAARPDDWLLRANFAAVLLAAGRATEAGVQWDEVARLLPGSPLPDLGMGPVLLVTGRFEEAADRYRKVLAADPLCGRAHRGLGDALAGLGQFDEAAAAYAEALRLDPADADARIGLGKVRAARGDVAGARAELEAALALGPDAEAEHQLGLLLMAKEGKRAEALPHLQRACELQPADRRYQNSCGAALLDLGKPDLAAVRFRTAVELDTNYSQARAALGRIEAARGRPGEAATYFREAAERKYDRPGNLDDLADTVTNFGVALLAVGEPDGARACFEAALGFTVHTEAEHQLGLLLLKERKPAEAVPHLQRAALITPTNPRYQSNLGSALAAAGRPEEAEKHFRQAIALDPTHTRAHAAFAELLMARGRHAEAIAHFRQSVALKHDPPGVLAALAFLLATAPDPQLRDGPEAVRLAEEACRRTTRRNVNCLDALIAAYATAGRFEDAVAAAREAIALAEATGDARAADLIRRRIPALEARQPPYPTK
jgi:Flp pilus assembly protein TadD